MHFDGRLSRVKRGFWRAFAVMAILVHSCLFAGFARAEQREFPQHVAAAIVDAKILAGRVGESLWPGFSGTPFGFMLIEEDRELLACDHRIPNGFVHLLHDRVLNCDVSVGPRTWRTPGLLAAMPVFGPPSVIVMGAPKATERSLARWQLTLLHEHFHQWQSAQPGYYDHVVGLNLARGDETGMWMLNYPFPYTAPHVQDAHAAATIALAEALDAPPAAADGLVKHYMMARARFAASVPADDWRYFEFQLWQEGAARWTELAFAERADNRAFADASLEVRQEIMAALRQPDLARDGRVSAYAMGAGEAMLLERMWPDWRSCYSNALALGPILKRGCASQ